MEQWRDIPGYEGRYEVSNMGRVYSHMRGGRVLRPGTMSSGHVSVSLGKYNSKCVHELVLIAFVGPRPDKCEARHLNGVPNGNRLDNLEWASRGENSQDKKWHKGGANQKLSGVEAAEIKYRLDNGEKGTVLAKEYGISSSTVYAIKAGVFHNDC